MTGLSWNCRLDVSAFWSAFCFSVHFDFDFDRFESHQGKLIGVYLRVSTTLRGTDKRDGVLNNILPPYKYNYTVYECTYPPAT